MARIRHSIIPVIAVVAQLLAGCAGTALAPSPSERQVLAPSGKLRVGLYPGSPTSILGDPAAPETKGVAFDLGKELARRLGVPFEPVVFPKNAEVIEALKAGQVDVAFTNASPARARDIDFTQPYLDVEQSYLVPAGSAMAAPADIDRPGIRVGVSVGSSSQAVLTRQFKNAVVVLVPTLKEAIEMLSQKQLDAFATNKAILFELSDSLPGSRVLAGRWGLEHFSAGIPKGRDLGMPYMRKFVEEVQSTGLVQTAVERAGVRGTVFHDKGLSRGP